MVHLVATDAAFTDAEEALLRTIAGMIVPPDPGRGLPSASVLDIASYIETFAPEQVTAVREEIALVERVARTWTDRSFASLEKAERRALIERERAGDPNWIRAVVTQVLCCYYQDEGVVTALGVESTPPYPQGNEVAPLDEALLEPVRARADEYRARLYRERDQGSGV